MASRMLWHSNPPWMPSGYGQQTALFVPRLAESFDVAVSAFSGLEGAPIAWRGIPVLPGMEGSFGNEELRQHARRLFGGPRDGLVVTLLDVWVLDHEMCAEHKVISWVPVDHDPAPPAVREYFEKSGAVPIAMSRFGQQQLAEFDALYVPHAVDTRVFRPGDQAAARQRLNVDTDRFLVGMVAANKGQPSRKSLVAALEAFAAFHRAHEDAVLYLHTDVEGIWGSGVDLKEVARALGVPEGAMRRPDAYRVLFEPPSPAVMADLYSAMDVLLSPSAGEGFGVPILEAAACGVPAIVTDFSAMPEVAGPGWRVPFDRTWTALKSWQALPHIPAIIDALEDAYAMPAAARADLSARTRAHALSYDIETVLTDHMLPALETAQERLDAVSERAELELREAA